MESEDLSDTEAVECSETESNERSEAIQQVNSVQLVAKKNTKNRKCGNTSDSCQTKMEAVLVTVILRSVNCVLRMCLRDGLIQAIF